MTAVRLSDWEPRLVAYVTAARETVRAGDPSFCALFSTGAVEAVTGNNPARRYRGRYRETADRLEAAFDETFPEIPPSLAQRGDLAWYEGVVGVIMGGDAVFVGERPDGTPDLVTFPRSAWSKAWGVGHG